MGESVISNLAKAQCISVKTFRKNGTAVATPMWSCEVDGYLSNYTDDRTYKVPRIRRNSRIEVAACDVWGKCSTPYYPATCTFIEGDEEARQKTFERLRKKYHIHWYMSLWGSHLVGRVKHRLVLKIELDDPNAEVSELKAPAA